MKKKHIVFDLFKIIVNINLIVLLIMDLKNKRDEEANEQLNERIKELRKALGLTLDKFGEQVGVKRSAIGNIENGVRGVTEQMFKSICREFNVNESWLRTGEGEMFVQRTLDDEIASFIQTIQLEKDDSFKKKFIKMLSSLDEADWSKLETMFKLCH